MKLCPKCQKHFSDDANFCPVDAARLFPVETPAAAPVADSLTSRFELGEQIGGHRTGAVHRATDKTTGKPCVIKLVAKSVMGLPGVAQRLERELKQLERVASTGVAKVIASGKRGDDTWLAVETLDGAQTLAQAISARGPIPADRAADLIEVIGEALIEAAQVGVVHRDLAPKNVLFAGQDVKLINFSLPVPTSDKVPGVPEFVAPEQIDGRPVDQRSNLYSLGALYYYVLTGLPVPPRTPEAAPSRSSAGTIPPPSSVAPGAVAAGSAIEAVIMRALDRSPTKRFLTVRQFVDEVARVGRGDVVELKQTMALGKAGSRPKGELVQTLMGIKGGGGMAAISSAPTVAPMAAVTAGPAQFAQHSQAQAPQAPFVPAAHAAPASPAQAVAARPAMVATEVGMAGGGGSPWAPAAQAAVAPHAPVVAAPIVAAPVVAAPVVGAPVVGAPQGGGKAAAAAPAGKKRAGDDGGSKGKFRETMWFKKGELDAQAAQAAADERAKTGKDAAADKADSLPIDERYKDDGSITRGDKEKYSLRTGATQMMAVMKEPGADASMNKVSEDALIGEMKSGSRKLIMAIGLAVIVIVVVIVLATR